MAAVTAVCEEGFYCPAGQSERRPEAYKCTAGNYCEAGSYEETPCAAGTYQPNDYASSCFPCPAGYYCLEGATAPIICAAQHFCAGSTKTEHGTDCAIGSYQPETGRTSCLKCPPGKYCDLPGQASPAGDCSEGYWCGGGATTSTPTGSGGDACAAGTYCPAGSAYALPCAPGYACPNALMTEA